MAKARQGTLADTPNRRYRRNDGEIKENQMLCGFAAVRSAVSSLVQAFELWVRSSGMERGMSMQVLGSGILTVQQRKSVIDSLVEDRLATVVPEAMRRAGIDMWLIICNEGVEDPVFHALVPHDPWAVKRLAMLVFYDRGSEGLEQLLIAHHAMDFYVSAWNEYRETQWQALERVIEERQPKRIGINQAATVPFGDGLTAGLKRKLVDSVGPDVAKAFESAEDVATEVLSRRLPREVDIYDEVVLVTRSIIKEAFSLKVITPGVTTTEDVRWWMQQRVVDLGLDRVSNGIVALIRRDPEAASFNGDYGSPRSDNVIRRGDAIYTDFGISYLGMFTDVQEWGYVPLVGEEGVPSGLRSAMASAHKMQDLLMAEMIPGRTGNEVLAAALTAGRELGLEPRIYTHPIGLHVHGAGAYVGTPDRQDPTHDLEIESRRGDYPLSTDSVYAIELSIDVPIPDWDGQIVRFPVEQPAIISGRTSRFLGGRQMDFYLVD